jgi:hypothetical protein
LSWVIRGKSDSTAYYSNINSRSTGAEVHGALGSHNSCDLGITECGFVSIDAGTPVGNVPYLGAAPDLGAFEAR